jgi:hypothetical protein
MAYNDDLHIDFDIRVSKSVLRVLNKRMCERDYDWDPSGVYSDGIRMRWRCALVDLKTFIGILKGLGISGKGWFLPSGTNCDKSWCIDKFSGEHEPHTIGYSGCEAVPKSEDWFTF